MILTPIKAYSSPSTTPEVRHREPLLMESPSPDCKDNAATVTSATASASAGASGGLQPTQLSSCDGELAVAPLPEGDLPGQFTRVMGKGTVLPGSPSQRVLRAAMRWGNAECASVTSRWR